VLEIDWQGARQVRESMPECVTIFILPPSLAELERRLRDRRTDKPEVIERRLRDARSDMSHWEEFDHVIINDDLDQAIAALEAVLRGEGEASSTANPELRDAVARIVA
jgi:guanylate kinase